MGRGGRRPGAGRKPKPKAFGGLHPFPVPAPMVPPSTNYPPAPVEEFDAPDSLTAEERAIWLKQAPHAFANRTLTKATALSFERYCTVVVMERYEAQSSGRGGSNHRGLLKQINAYELQFNLTPCGKPMPEPAAVQPVAQPESKLAKFRNG
jgi:hypothetical protein